MKSIQKQASYASDAKRLIGLGPSPSDAAKEGVGRLTLPPVTPGLTPEQRGPEMLRIATEAFSQTSNWVVFYREILAPGGLIDTLFPTAEERRHFETTDAFAEVLEMIASLRSQDPCKMPRYDTDRVITVRIPSSLHEAIIREAQELGLSINKFCLTKLLQPAHKRFTPLELNGRRGRKPGPQLVLIRTRAGKPIRLEPKTGED